MDEPTRTPTILVVDDNPDLLHLIAESLSVIGQYQVVRAINGIEGLEKYYEYRPDCVVIDVKMPGMDGYQLVRALRGDPSSADTPLVILTALVQEKDRLIGLSSGVDFYLAKPIKPRELVAAIQNALQAGDEARKRRMEQLVEDRESFQRLKPFDEVQ
jgi:CheY-like chemotaxis protein